MRSDVLSSESIPHNSVIYREYKNNIMTSCQSLTRLAAIIYDSIGLSSRWSGVRFLCYHAVVEDIESLHPGRRAYAISADEFKRHLTYFQHTGVSIVSMEQALWIIREGSTHKGKNICMTFDDGYMDNFDIAWSILQHFGYSAHFFIVPGFVGKTYSNVMEDQYYERVYMTVSEISQIISAGGSVGAHSMSHAILPQIDERQLYHELADSKQQLESWIGRSIETFAYPSGRYNKLVVNTLNRVGYAYSFNLGYGSVVRISGMGSYAIRRNVICGNNEAQNNLVISGGYDCLHTYSTIKDLFLRFCSCSGGA